jgi:hypothetical protein
MVWLAWLQFRRMQRGYESAAEKARAAKDASDKEAAAATAAAERRKRRPPPRPAERKEREDPLRMEKMKAVAREAIGKRIAIVRPVFLSPARRGSLSSGGAW